MNTITITGNLGRAAETKVTKNGYPVTTLAIAHTPREKVDGEWTDGETLWFKVTVWASLEASMYQKGQRVIVSGELGQESYEKDGEKRTSLIIKAATVGALHLGNVVAQAASDPWPATSEEAPW